MKAVRIGGAIAAAALATVTLAACTSGGTADKKSEPDTKVEDTTAEPVAVPVAPEPVENADWEDELRQSVRDEADADPTSTQEACDGFKAFDIHTPQEFYDWMQLTDQDLIDARTEFETEIDFPDGVATKDIIFVGIDETLNYCNL